MSTATLPYEHLGEALATDYFGIRKQFTEEQWQRFIDTRRFVDQEVLPVINDYWESAELPWPLMRRLPELGLVGEDIEGYGCLGMSPLARGLVHMELHRGDGSLGTFLGVQAGLAMKSIAMLDSEEQKKRWLPALASLEAIGAFALTEPAHGSDSVSLETTARRDRAGWVIDGQKRSIGTARSLMWSSYGHARMRTTRSRDSSSRPGPTAFGRRRWRARAPRVRSGKRRSGSTAYASGRRAGCRAPNRSRTLDGCWSIPAPRAPGLPSATRSRPTTRR
jgi:alkylation response protein AidB-like acyl-CoA dehydrogenase